MNSIKYFRLLMCMWWKNLADIPAIEPPLLYNFGTIWSVSTRTYELFIKGKTKKKEIISISKCIWYFCLFALLQDWMCKFLRGKNQLPHQLVNYKNRIACIVVAYFRFSHCTLCILHCNAGTWKANHNDRQP